MAKDSSEIVKLTERISKDPKSKLFVPLAEEYKKMGDMEMAIHVLSEGLKVNPGYVTARSFLGRLLLEQGNFAAAQKEFEEVVKAIPDNLLAQRKLGDLHLLQSRQEEALKHYKIALILNPSDVEIASLISDIETGVVAGVVQQKPVTSPDLSVPSPQPLKSSAGTPPLSPSPPAQAAVEEPSVASAERAPDVIPEKEESEPIVEKPAEALIDESSPLNERSLDLARQPVAPVMDQEEAEEVFVVEPLNDEQVPGPAPKSSEIDFFSEKVFETNPAEEQTDAVPASSPPVFEEPVLAEAKTEQIIIPDSNVVIGEGPEPELPGEEQSVNQTGADDFTTDTLAELYIAQGFFEKAIDIYQRMLADNPNSRGLKDKLERVKSMAIPVSEEGLAPAAEEKTAPETTEEAILFAEPKEYVPPVENQPEEAALFAEAKEYVLPAESQEEEITIDAELYVEPQQDLKKSPEPAKKTEADIFAEPQEYRPQNEPEEWTGPAPAGTAVDSIFMPPQEEAARPMPQYSDFEPREYIPPTTEQQPAKEETARTAPKPDAATNKATIDRLEHWLSNIKKEK